MLKNGGSNAEFEAFEAEIATHAERIYQKRKAGAGHLLEVLQAVYSGLADADEGPDMIYKPNVEADSALDFARSLEASRKRDEILGSTQKGPHRDDFELALKVGGAKEYASDGQQRGLCVALRIAQASIYRSALGVVPVLLVDDVLGELDPQRRAGFWRACPGELQIVATGTESPEEATDEWVVKRVSAGQIGSL